MVDVNRMTTPANMRWLLVDRETGAENAAIDWQLKVGDQVKIRLVNEMDSDHPMHHPIHIHGAGRFLILSRDDVVEPNLVWKDTVLVRTGETVDILLDVTNPGIWMVHCHIAEHHESGMMFSFNVAPRRGRRGRCCAAGPRGAASAGLSGDWSSESRRRPHRLRSGGSTRDRLRARACGDRPDLHRLRSRRRTTHRSRRRNQRRQRVHRHRRCSDHRHTVAACRRPCRPRVKDLWQDRRLTSFTTRGGGLRSVS